MDYVNIIYKFHNKDNEEVISHYPSKSVGNKIERGKAHLKIYDSYHDVPIFSGYTIPVVDARPDGTVYINYTELPIEEGQAVINKKLKYKVYDSKTDGVDTFTILEMFDAYHLDSYISMYIKGTACLIPIFKELDKPYLEDDCGTPILCYETLQEYESDGLVENKELSDEYMNMIERPITYHQAKDLIWMNMEQCTGDNITINRNFLAWVLRRLEDSAYECGNQTGYKLRGMAEHEELPINLDFKNMKEEW